MLIAETDWQVVSLDILTYAGNLENLAAVEKTNDEGWAGIFESWLRVSRLPPEDSALVFPSGAETWKTMSARSVVGLRQAALDTCSFVPCAEPIAP